MEEKERYTVEARIFADGKIITKVRPALPEEESYQYGTRACEIWIDVYHIVRLLNRHRSSVLQAEDGTWQRVYAYRDLDTEDWPDTPG